MAKENNYHSSSYRRVAEERDNPNVPMTPSEIADDVYACWKAGAAIAICI